MRRGSRTARGAVVLVAVATGAVTTAAFATKPANQAAPRPQPREPSVVVAEGQLTGVSRGGVSIYRAIPYAAPPTGERRWSDARPAAPYDGIRDARAFGASCPQPVGGAVDPRFAMWTKEYLTPPGPGIDEDCLFANIWTPAPANTNRSAGKLPVLLFLHGGAYFSGSGSVPVYDGEMLARRGIVVVTINYRLGALGFMAHPELTAAQGGSGNYGIKDQMAALRWLQRNISAFGGDPHKITVVGQSAGAGSVLALLAAPAARGMFRGAVIQSVPLEGNFKPLAGEERIGIESLAYWKAQDIAGARQLPVARLLEPQPGRPLRFLPGEDGILVHKGAERRPIVNDVPIMIGYTLNDLFVPSRSITASAWRSEAQERYGTDASAFLHYYPGQTDREASASAQREATTRVEMSGILRWLETARPRRPVYAYLFSHEEPGTGAGEFGAFHSSELPYEFDTLHLSPGRRFTSIDLRVADQFSSALVNFVRTLKPAGGSVPAWTALTSKNKAIMEFGDEARSSRMMPEGAEAVLARGRPTGP